MASKSPSSIGMSSLRSMQSMRRGVAYVLGGGGGGGGGGGRLYLQPSGLVNGFPWPLLRGPAFLPTLLASGSDSGLVPLAPDGSSDPTAAEMADVVERYYEVLDENNQGVIGMGENDTGATFAGIGEPTFRLDEICDAARIIHERRHGVPLRLVTTMLPADVGGADDVAQRIADARISDVTINLCAENPKAFQTCTDALVEQYTLENPNEAKHAVPVPTDAFANICALIEALSTRGVAVECCAVEAPGASTANTRALAEALGATSFRTRSYHP